MSWERRQRGTRYYVRSHRVAGRATKEYIGNGPLGEYAAAVDALARINDGWSGVVFEMEKRVIGRCEKHLDQLDEVASTLMDQELIPLGYHYRGGEWRRKHGFQQPKD